MDFYDLFIEQLERIFYKKGRQIFLHGSMRKIGNIVVYGDKIVCYVEQKKLDKLCDEVYSYRVSLSGVDKNDQLCDFYDLDKPVYYIFDNIDFDKRLFISSFNCFVVFKNCTFDSDVKINFNENIRFDGCRFSGKHPSFDKDVCHISGENNMNITFINQAIVDNDDAGVDIDITAKQVDFDFSCIDISNPGVVSIKCDKLNVDNSIFLVNELYIDAESISNNGTYIKCDTGAMIDNKDYDFDGKINSLVSVYNMDRDKSYYDDPELINESRERFLNQLRNIRDYCDLINKEKLKEFKDELDNNAVKKALRR